MKKRLIPITVAALMLGVASCGGGDDTEKKPESKEIKDIKDDDTNDTTDAEMDMDDEFSEDEVQLPSALQVAQLLNSLGLSYSEGLTNSTDNSSNYSSEISKKLNFGVYSADLSYLVINEKYGEAQAYMSTVRDLGTATGLDKIFNSEDLLTRFEANQSNRDSLIEILIDINYRTEEIFENDPEVKAQSIIHFSGAWIEGMYLGSKTLIDGGSEDLGTAVVDQMNILSSIIAGLKKREAAGDELGDLISQLEDVLNTFNNFETVKASASSEVGNYTFPELTDEELKQLSEKIDELRSSIVNG